jgi:hypothetical protein
MKGADGAEKNLDLLLLELVEFTVFTYFKEL